MRRRDFLLGSTAALGLAGCGRTAVPRPPSPVNITRAAAYSQDIYDTMRRVLAEHKLNVRGHRVVLKPNLVEFEPESAINTHPMLVHATLRSVPGIGRIGGDCGGPRPSPEHARSGRPRRIFSARDRESTSLNSSHLGISYSVF